MHDTLDYFQQESIDRRYHHELTFSLTYAFNENFVLPVSHDEVVHGKGSLSSKMAGDRWQKLANLRVLPVVVLDSARYGGSDVGNLGAILPEPVPWHGQTVSAEITLPPLAAVWLVPNGD